MYHPEAINQLRKEVREAMNVTADVILTSPLPLEEYRKHQGVIEGLARAEQMIVDMQSRVDQGGIDAE